MIKGDFSGDYENLFLSLQDVARDDPIRREMQSSWFSHDDGWGFVFYNKNTLIHERFKEPIFKSNIVSIPKDGILIMHARKASENEPKGVLHAHPHVRYDRNYIVFLAHNGSFNKDILAGMLNEKNKEKQTDTEFFLEFLMSLEGNMVDRINKMIEIAKEREIIEKASNIFILSVEKLTGNVNLFYYSFAKDLNEYIKLYRVKSETWEGIFSSSIIRSKYFPRVSNIDPVPTDKILTL